MEVCYASFHKFNISPIYFVWIIFFSLSITLYCIERFLILCISTIDWFGLMHYIFLRGQYYDVCCCIAYWDSRSMYFFLKWTYLMSVYFLWKWEICRSWHRTPHTSLRTPFDGCEEKEWSNINFKSSHVLFRCGYMLS